MRYKGGRFNPNGIDSNTKSVVLNWSCRCVKNDTVCVVFNTSVLRVQCRYSEATDRAAVHPQLQFIRS